MTMVPWSGSLRRCSVSAARQRNVVVVLSIALCSCFLVSMVPYATASGGECNNRGSKERFQGKGSQFCACEYPYVGRDCDYVLKNHMDSTVEQTAADIDSFSKQLNASITAISSTAQNLTYIVNGVQQSVQPLNTSLTMLGNPCASCPSRIGADTVCVGPEDDLIRQRCQRVFNVGFGTMATAHDGATGDQIPFPGADVIVMGDLTSGAPNAAPAAVFVPVGNGTSSSKQFVQVDLGVTRMVHTITVARPTSLVQGGLLQSTTPVTYPDQVLLVGKTNTPSEMTVVYNTDSKNVHGFGSGLSAAYNETSEGHTFDLRLPMEARYIRMYTNGHLHRSASGQVTSSGESAYVNIRVKGTAINSVDSCVNNASPCSRHNSTTRALLDAEQCQGDRCTPVFNVAFGKSFYALNSSAAISSFTQGSYVSILSRWSNDNSLYYSPKVEDNKAGALVDLQGVFLVSKVKLVQKVVTGRTYQRQVWQLSQDGTTWFTMYNSDTQGIHGQGTGTDSAVVATKDGHNVTLATPVTARFVRFLLHGSNHGIENYIHHIAVFGSPAYDFSQEFGAGQPCSQTYCQSLHGSSGICTKFGCQALETNLNQDATHSWISNAKSTTCTHPSRQLNNANYNQNFFCSMDESAESQAAAWQGDMAYPSLVTGIHMKYLSNDVNIADRTYRTQVWQLSQRGGASLGDWYSVFNSDSSNSHGRGAGSDSDVAVKFSEQWKLFRPSKGTLARYFRFYITDNSNNPAVHASNVQIQGYRLAYPTDT